MSTRSPGATYPSRPEYARTMPTPSWPRTMGVRVGMWPCCTARSVWHNPEPRTSTTALRGGRLFSDTWKETDSWTRRGEPTLHRTAARPRRVGRGAMEQWSYLLSAGCLVGDGVGLVSSLSVGDQLEGLAALEHHLSALGAVGALELQNDLLGRLGLLVEHGLRLTSVTLLFAVVSTLTLGRFRSLARLVKRYSHGLVLLALLTQRSELLGERHHLSDFLYDSSLFSATLKGGNRTSPRIIWKPSKGERYPLPRL